MSKAAPNRARRAQAAARHEPDSRRRTRTLYAAVAVVAAAVAGALVLASVLTARDDDSAPSAGDAGTVTVAGAESRALLAGIPRQGIALGRPNARVTLVEFADLQCPFCAEWSRNALPELVRDYVRPGRVRIVFRGLTFIGPDSEEALRFALAAGEQEKLWNVVDLLYENQGGENEGWVTDDLLNAVGGAVPGLDVERVFAERSGTRVDAELEAAEEAATESGIRGTPSFAVGRTGGTLRVVELDSLDAQALRPDLDALLAG
jgi:protein-disulfide isomerase